MPSTGILPYDLSNLLKGPTPFIYGLASEVAVPANLADILDTDDPAHPLAEGWTHGGATSGGASYNRQFSTSGYQIDQADGNVDEDVTDVARSITVPIAELTPELIQLLEQAADIDTVAAAKGRSAEKQIKVGSIETLETYRVVFLGRRLKGKGADVTMSGGKVRGAFVGYCMLMAKIGGDQASMGFQKGSLVVPQLTFNAFPDDSQEPGEEHGVWIVEESGTIEAAE